MSDNDSSIRQGVSRRTFVKAAGATGVASTLAGCGGGGGGTTDNGGNGGNGGGQFSEYAGNIAPQAVLSWSEEPSRKPFTNKGQAVMHRNWPYAINIAASDENLGDDLGVMPIPMGVSEDEAEYPMTGGPVAALGGWHMVINKFASDRQKSAARRILETMMKDEFKLFLFKQIGWLPPEPELLKSQDAKSVEPMGQFVDTLRVAGQNAIPRPVTAVWSQESSKVSAAVNGAYAKQQSPKRAMTSLKKTLKQIEKSAQSPGKPGQGGTSVQDKDPGSITVQWAADGTVADNGQAIKDKLYELGLSKDIDIEILAGSQLTDKRQQRYQQWLGAGKSKPTLLMMDNGWTLPFILQDYLQPLDDVLGESAVSTINDNYFQAMVQTATGPNGKLFGMPLFPDFPTMLYRKDLVEAAGYGESDFETWQTEALTWKEFSNITKDALEEAPSEVKYGFSFQAKDYAGLSCCDFNEFMTSFGGAYFGNPEENLFGPVGDRPITVDEQPVIDSIKMVRKFIHGSV